MRTLTVSIVAVASALLLTSCTAESNSGDSQRPSESATVSISEDFTPAGTVWDIEEFKTVLPDGELSEGEVGSAPTIYASNDNCSVSASVALDEEPGGLLMNPLYDTQLEAYANLLEGDRVESQYISEIATNTESTVSMLTLEYGNVETGETKMVSSRTFTTEDNRRGTANIDYICNSGDSLDSDLYESLLKSIVFSVK